MTKHTLTKTRAVSRNRKNKKYEVERPVLRTLGTPPKDIQLNEKQRAQKDTKYKCEN